MPETEIPPVLRGDIYLRPEVTEGGGDTLFGALPCRLIGKRRLRTYEKALAPHLGALPRLLVGEKAAMLLPPPFCPSRPGHAGGAAKNAPFSRNAQAVRPKTPLSPGIRRRRGQNRPFLPEYAGDMVENELFSGDMPAVRPEISLLPSPTQGIEWKRTLSEPRRAACAAVFLFAGDPPLAVPPSIGGPLHRGSSFRWRLCVPGRLFRARQRRLVFEKVSVFTASAAFHPKRGECFT